MKTEIDTVLVPKGLFSLQSVICFDPNLSPSTTHQVSRDVIFKNHNTYNTGKHFTIYIKNIDT